ncbi:MAG: tetratricopeptide repeat protein [Bacteroidota bacterium]
MANSFYRLTAENTVEDFSGRVVHHAASGFYYTAYRDGDRFVQEEYRLGSGGTKTHRLVREMTYVVGSGSAARTYLAEVSGRLFELPLTWYTQARGGAGRWDMSPGYEVVNSRFDRTIPARCMACHNGNSVPVDHVPGKFAELDNGIGCEQCHGPGSVHIEARLEDPEPSGGDPDWQDPTIVNPADLELERRLDVCQQCHLHGSVSLLREGEAAYSYRPGEPLQAHRALFATVEDANAFSVISHADRMKASACFLESQATPAAMDCVTCHNPHEGFREAGPDYFNQTCRSCHATEPLQAAMPTPELVAQHSIEANCFACHMPKVEAVDAPHSSFTDHWIRVVKDGDAEAFEGEQVAERGLLQAYFRRDQMPDESIYEAMAYVVLARQEGDLEALGESAIRLQSALAASPTMGEAQYLHGFALLEQNRPQDAIPSLERAVELGPAIPERLNALAQAYEAAQRNPADAERLYRQALEVQPALADVRVNLGRLLQAQGRIAEAEEAYRTALAEHPWLPQVHYNLGTLQLQQGQAEAAVASLREAITLDPNHGDALTNLGVYHAMQNDAREARRFFERAVQAEPRNANALANLGTFYVQTEQWGRAERTLTRAIEAEPTHADALANLALAYFQQGRSAEARTFAQRALTVRPGHPLAQQLLGAL